MVWVRRRGREFLFSRRTCDVGSGAMNDTYVGGVNDTTFLNKKTVRIQFHIMKRYMKSELRVGAI